MSLSEGTIIIPFRRSAGKEDVHFFASKSSKHVSKLVIFGAFRDPIGFRLANFTTLNGNQSILPYSDTGKGSGSNCYIAGEHIAKIHFHSKS